MAATFQFNQGNGTASGGNPATNTDIGAGAGENGFNFKTNDDATPANYSSNPITAGDDSMEVYVRGHFTGTFNSVSNLKFWNSTQALTGYGTGASIKAAKINAGSYVTPTTTPNADSAVPTTSGAALAPAYASNFSDWLRLQLHTVASGATPGDGGSNIFTLQYDES